uniref:Integrase catalytic domain-containing protein n=2 Tax=Meloidogyne incognita group TaxID=654580 RepID=A0A914KWV4_MELIC
MSYLDSLLRGEPKKVVQGLLPFSEANYNLAVDLLKSKYGKNEKIIRDLHNKLSSIPESRSIEDDIVNQVEVERVCRQLEHYNQDLKSPQIFLALEQKMSKKVLLKYLDLKQNEGTEPWTTELYRKCYAKAVEHCQMINEIYRKGKKVKEVDKKSSKVNHGEPLSPTMNFAIRYQPKDSRKPWRASDEGPLRPGRERERERRQDRKNRSRREFEDSSSRSSLYSSVSSNTSTSQSRNGRNQKGSPWPRDTRGKERFIRGESSSNSRSPARYPCQLCQGKHFPLDCDKYKTIEDRKKQIQELALCYICLKKGHNARECPRYNLPCFLCKRPKHNVALCGKRVPKTEQVTLTMYEKEVNDLKEVNSLSAKIKGIIKKPDESFTLLKCIEVTIYNPQKPNLRKRVIVFLDPGSERSYITKKLGEELELVATGQANFNISGLGGVQLGTYESRIVEFGVKGKNCDRIIKARAIEKVMRDLKFIKYRKAQLKELSENKINLKPDNVEPEVLIGNDYYDTFHVSVLERLANGFFINDSSLGKFLSGEGRMKSREKQEANKTKPSVVLASVQEDDIEFEAKELRKPKSSDLELNKLVERQTNLETIGLADANNDEDKICDAVVRELERNTYVDNLLIGIEDPEELQSKYTFLKRIFEEANMNVREFTSNAWQEVLKLPESDRGGTESTKLLGLIWNLKEDTLTIKLPKFTEEKVTRRTILAQIAKPYDPLGLISPVILKGKRLRQQVEKDKNLNWDKPVDQKSEEDWKKLIKTWNGQSISISRKCWNSGEDRSKIELHGFADASIYGIGIAIYLRRVGNKIETTLVFAKSLVIPSIIGKRKTSIPSLELHAMKICCTNIEFVKRELEKENRIEKVRLWTDAADVIDYLTTGKEKDRFVKNRIKVIRNYHVTHVVGKDNPADLASRGCSVEELKESKIWFEGPGWLSKEEAYWPTSLKEYNPETFVPQETTNAELQLSLVANDINEEIIPICNFERFSQWKRVRNCMAYVLRAVEHFKHPEKDRRKNMNCEINLVPPLMLNEITSAEIFLILEAQEMFPPKEESICNLGLFQEHGIWRAGGRLQNSELEPNAIHPIYLHQAAPIVPLIIADMHKERKHTGTINLCAALRQTYWIPKCRRTVVNVIQKNLKTKCHLCERYYVKAYDYPEAPPLPDYRVSGKEIWETTGIDYFGPMTVRSEDGKSTLKIWGAIFVCALSRIIHLELVLDATAEKFLLAFTRFARRWRIPKRIISDNGTNFVLGSKGLKKLCQENAKERQLWLEIYEKREVKEYSAKDKIEWVFITPFAPWRGGLYERMIGVVKHHLKRVIARKTMTIEEMWTLLVEVERIVNERPITFLSESEVLKPLRPIDLAFPLMKANEMDIATEPFDKDDPNYFEQSNSRESLIDKYKNAVSAAEWFWKEWKKSYLLALREKHVNCAKKPQLRPEKGDVVIIEDKIAPRNLWKLGKITEILSVRTAKVRVGNKEFERAIKHLYPLEVNEFGVVEEMNKDETNQSKGVKTEKEIKISEKFEDSNNFAISDQQKMEEDLIQIDETEAIFSKEELEQAEKILDEEEEDTISLDGGVIIEIATETKLIPKEKQRFSTTQGGNFRVDVPTWLLGDDNIEILGEVVREKEYRALTSNYPLESVWWTTLPGRAKLNQLLTTVIFWCSMLSPNIYGVFRLADSDPWAPGYLDW